MISATYKSGDSVGSGATSTIPCFVDCCSAGVVGQWYTFNAGDVVTDQLGGGPLADQVLAFLSNAPGPCYATPAAATWSAAPSVTHVGTGPAVTCALAGGASGPYDNHTTVITITVGGANSATGGAMMSVAFDGSTVVETLPVPQQGPANLIGTTPITPTTLGLFYAGAALTVIFAAPAVETLTFNSAGSLAAAAAGLKIATATSGSPVTLHASDLLTAGIAAILANPRAIRFTTAGSTPAHVPATAVLTGTDYTGATISETIVPDTSAGSVTSTKVYASITSIAYAAAGGTDATIALGYEDTYASATEFIAEVNTLLVAAPEAVTAFAAQQSDGTHLGLQSTALGTGVSVTLNAGTGQTNLGFTSSATATGTAATYAPPWTGLVFTFPSGTYIAKDSYTSASVGPTTSVSAVLAALAIGRANWRTNPFGYFAVTAPPSSASNAASLQAACSSTVAPWRADCSCPVFVMTGTPFHTASSTPATNAANILATDNAVAAAFLANAAALDLVAVDDCYVQGSKGLRPGSFRRSAVLAAAIRRASLAKLGSDLAEGIVPGVTLRGPDGLTLARDEFYATVKLGPAAGGNSGPGFSCLKSTTAGLGSPKFAAGTTRAGSTSRYRFSYVVVVGLEMGQTLFARAQTWEGQTWPTNPATGAILDSEAAHRAKDCISDLVPLLTPEGKDPSVSSFAVTIDNSGVFVNTGNVPLNGSFVTLGLVMDVTITVTAFGIAPASLTP